MMIWMKNTWFSHIACTVLHIACQMYQDFCKNSFGVSVKLISIVVMGYVGLDIVFVEEYIVRNKDWLSL